MIWALDHLKISHKWSPFQIGYLNCWDLCSYYLSSSYFHRYGHSPFNWVGCFLFGNSSNCTAGFHTRLLPISLWPMKQLVHKGLPKKWFLKYAKYLDYIWNIYYSLEFQGSDDEIFDCTKTWFPCNDVCSPYEDTPHNNTSQIN